MKSIDIQYPYDFIALVYCDQFDIWVLSGSVMSFYFEFERAMWTYANFSFFGDALFGRKICI